MRVGVIGGGQLAWMMETAARKLNIALVVQTPSNTDPAASIAAQTVLAPVADATATAELASLCDVITFENEFVDLPALFRLAEQGVQFYPRLTSLAPLLDKFDQRSFLDQIGVPVPRFTAVQALAADLEQFGLPAVLKARRHGYDGQGTFVLRHPSDVDLVKAQPAADHWLLEAFIPFERELAVMAARSMTGEMVIYPVVETVQKNQVCQRVYVTPMPDAVTEQVGAIARLILERLDYVGVMGIEFFLDRDGQVLVNELAPRTHNSGHYTLDACVTSQFEQQLRAVCGLPLGSPALTCAGAVMINLLGYDTAEANYFVTRQQQLNKLSLPMCLYWYGKSARPGRKLGHVTVLLEVEQGRPQAEAIAEQIEQIWYGQAGSR